MRCGKKKGLFSKLVKQFGIDSFEYSLLKPEYDLDKLKVLEAEFIEKLNPTLNISKGFGTTKYEKSVYSDILLFKYRNLHAKLSDVTKQFPNISPGVISDVINLRKYSWLKEEFPVEYRAILENILY